MTCINGIEQNSRKANQEHFLVHLYKVSSHGWNVLIDSINYILRPKTQFRLLKSPNSLLTTMRARSAKNG